MNVLPTGLSRILRPALAGAALCLCACGGDTSKYSESRGDTQGGGAGDAAATVAAAGTGSIRGRVTFAGTPPERRPIEMSGTAQCATLHEETVYEPDVIVGADGGLQNCFVLVQGAPRQPPPAEPQVVDQKGCMYEPHVLGVQVGQTLNIKSSDPFAHNVHFVPELNEERNIHFPMIGAKTHKFERPEVMVKFKCEVHPWMSAYVGVTEHPWYAVSGADGTFEIAGVPAGNYTLLIWHERFGRREVPVTVSAGQTAEANQTFQG